ncbi:MAG: Uncharacterised protein [Marine Group II euryarchaeote MED-G33]|nr:MAG: Uncharacterised protein [Marine Group II euryarchaeote MED-G33]
MSLSLRAELVSYERFMAARLSNWSWVRLWSLFACRKQSERYLGVVLYRTRSPPRVVELCFAIDCRSDNSY